MTLNIVLLVLLVLVLLLYGQEMVQPQTSTKTSTIQALPIVNGDSDLMAVSTTAPGPTGEMIDVQGTEGAAVATNRRPGFTLFDFSSQGAIWNIVNDQVMGGLSTSSVHVDEDRQTLTFSGQVSLENNGGFASARSQWLRYDLADYDGVALRVRGDGRIYRFRIRTEKAGAAVSYTALFQTEKGVWQEVTIPFKEMVPLYRGMLVKEAGPLDASSVRSFGLMVADNQSGAFDLEVDWIKAISISKDGVQYPSLEVAASDV